MAAYRVRPNGDQHQFSPTNIITKLKGKVIRINKMIMQLQEKL